MMHGKVFPNLNIKFLMQKGLKISKLWKWPALVSPAEVLVLASNQRQYRHQRGSTLRSLCHDSFKTSGKTTGFLGRHYLAGSLWLSRFGIFPSQQCVIGTAIRYMRNIMNGQKRQSPDLGMHCPRCFGDGVALGSLGRYYSARFGLCLWLLYELLARCLASWTDLLMTCHRSQRTYQGQSYLTRG